MLLILLIWGILMNYYINPACLTSVFTVPSIVADNHLKFAKAEHLKVLIYILRNISNFDEVSLIAEATDLSEYEVSEALLYWADAGILCPKEKIAEVPTPQKVALKSEKPNRSDVLKRGNEDPKIRYLLREAQLKFGRNLKTNESNTLVWLYDDLGLDVSLILLIIQHAVAHNKANIRFIESTAVRWVDKGINSITAADEELRLMALGEQAWGIVSSAFGIERRKPSQKETDYSVLWIEEWKLSREMLVAAYEECVNQKSKFIFSYVIKVLENWHSKGYQKPEDIEKKLKNSDDSNGIAAYDLDLFEKMISSKD